MTTTRKKRPRDPVQLGKLIVEIATGQMPDAEKDGKIARATTSAAIVPSRSSVTGSCATGTASVEMANSVSPSNGV